MNRSRATCLPRAANTPKAAAGLTAALALATAGCGGANSVPTPAAPPAQLVGVAAPDGALPAPPGTAAQDVSQTDEFRSFSLTIYGYNYTDTEIGSFEVNGRGGGNLAVSSPTSAGGSGVCCAALYTPLPQSKAIRIKWTRDGDRWCEQDVPFGGPVPANARYLEVHFYRDGHIEIAVTHENSPPRFSLERLHGNSRHRDPALNVNNDEKYSRCKDGYR